MHRERGLARHRGRTLDDRVAHAQRDPRRRIGELRERERQTGDQALGRELATRDEVDEIANVGAGQLVHWPRMITRLPRRTYGVSTRGAMLSAWTFPAAT